MKNLTKLKEIKDISRLWDKKSSIYYVVFGTSKNCALHVTKKIKQKSCALSTKSNLTCTSIGHLLCLLKFSVGKLHSLQNFQESA